MNLFEGVEFNQMQFIAPLIILILTMVAVTLVYGLLFSWLPKKLYNYLVGPVALFGAYLWAIPMNMGFYEFFK